VIAEIRTAAAITSFAFLARGCTSGFMRLTMSSSEVLINSTTKTKEIVNRSSNHSLDENPKNPARIKTKIAIAKWILKLGSSWKAVFIPSIAYWILLRNEVCEPIFRL